MDSSGGQNASFDAKVLLDAAPCGLLSFDDGGQVVYANAVLLEHLGLSSDELVGRLIKSILSPGDRVFYQTHLFPMIRLHGRVDEIFLTLKGSEGREIPMLSNAVRVSHDGSFVNHCVFVPVRRRQQFEAELVQARKRAEKALHNNEKLQETQDVLESRTRQLDRRLTRVAAQNAELRRLTRIMSHDLREPIRKMATFADIIAAESRDALSELGSEALGKMLAASVRMGDLLTGLEQYLTLDSPQETRSVVDLNKVIAAAGKEAGRRSGKARVEPACGSLPEVEGYESQLTQLFVQLFDNALKFSRKDVNPSLSVDCAVIQHNRFRSVTGKYRYVDHARIAVSDNGVGFEPRFNEYVFEILKKLDPDSPGMGMGLAISKKIVANHYGAISIDSRPGVGTTVTVTLPLKQDDE